jgi:hypothetical protein
MQVSGTVKGVGSIRCQHAEFDKFGVRLSDFLCKPSIFTRDRADVHELSCQTFVAKVSILTHLAALEDPHLHRLIPDHVSGETFCLAPAVPQIPRPAHRKDGYRRASVHLTPGRLRPRHHQRTHPTPTTSIPTNTANMPGVSVRDVQADKFINAYAAFLKRQGKLPIPGS